MKKILVLFLLSFVSYSLAVPMEKCVNTGARYSKPIVAMFGGPSGKICFVSCPTGGKFEIYSESGNCDQTFYYCSNLPFTKDEIPILGEHWSGRKECPSRKEVQDYHEALSRAASEKMQKELKAECGKNKKKAEAILKEQRIARDGYISENGDEFIDGRDGVKYRSIKIGNQKWMAENLRYNQKSACKKGQNCKSLGGLYNWENAVNSCPDGWHLPTKQEFLQLLQNTGLQENGVSVDALRAIDGWGTFDKCGRDVIYKHNGTDVFGFSALPTKWEDDGYTQRGSAMFWTSTKGKTVNGSFGGVAMTIDKRSWEESSYITERVVDPNFGMSVRCVRDMANSYVSAHGGTMIDSRDGTSYKTIKIGVLNWMASNLNYQTKNSECVKDDECSKYGRRYTRDEALKVCPNGWHLPTKEEYSALKNNVGNKVEKLQDAYAWVGGTGTDDYGFSALPTSENRALYWTASLDSEHGNGKCNYYFLLRNDGIEIKECDWSASLGSMVLPVRCVENMQMDNLETFTDERDGNEYKLITIGAQVWMAENLNFDTGSSEAVCYKNKHYNCKKYGRLYSREVINRVCPSGFRLPNDSDYEGISNKTEFNATVQRTTWEQRFWTSDRHLYANLKLYSPREGEFYPIRCMKE